MSTILYLDANIFMYAVGAPHPLNPLKMPCVQILSDIGNLDAQFAISVEIVQEILHRYIAIKRQTDAIRVANHVMSLVPTLYPLEASDMQRAIQICATNSNLNARDAIHVATMLNHGIIHIISADTHFDTVTGIRRLEPLNWNTLRQQFL